MFVKECQAIPKMYLVYGGQILRARAYFNIAGLSTTWKFYASDQTVRHGLKWNNARQLEIFTKMPLRGSFKFS